MLNARELKVFYGVIQGLKGVDIDVYDREIVTLIGSNGAGKTSTLNGIVNLVRSSGRVSFLNDDISRSQTHQIVRRGLALVPEGRRVFTNLTIEENLRMGAYNNLAGYARLRDRMYALFPRLKERRHQMAGTMSGGEQQMLAIARALMSRPRLLLLDEPSLGLAPLVVKQIFQILRELTAQGMTLFLVEQNARHALNLSDRAYVMVNGQIRLSGSGQTLLNDPEVRKAYLGISG
ncbi:TPA: ABC transporter ATP-binding protein [Klebsiella pneumoniae]|nr:ABC transporter ATP-binding protein [Klebsiella pneumoniae]HBV2472633.1 ABC transporter ATP-binding protein [Klebsiella pneumoniae]HBX8141971.1 ABC transporter ATP-binding protein [Klebsiella pneumoniae]